MLNIVIEILVRVLEIVGSQLGWTLFYGIHTIFPEFWLRMVAPDFIPENVGSKYRSFLYLSARLSLLYCIFYLAPIVWRACYYSGTSILNFIRSYLIDWLKQSNRFEDVMRAAFRRAPILDGREARVHSHPHSARLRSAMSNSAEVIAEILGCEPYYIQMSKTDVYKNRNGSRVHYWWKDTSINSKAFDPKSNHCNIFIDVDEYIDMNRFLALNHKPAIIYTLQPKAVAAQDDEWVFCFNKQNEVVYRVQGGALYCHKVWNYTTDVLTVRYVGFLTTTFASYHVDRKMVDEHHEMIFLTPINRVVLPFWLPLSLGDTDLKRYSVVSASEEGVEYNTLRYLSEDGPLISLGRPEETNECTMPLDVYEGLLSSCRSVHQKVASALIQKCLRQYWTEENPDFTPAEKLKKVQLVVDYLRSAVKGKKMWVDSGLGLVSYTFEPDLDNLSDPRVTVMPFMTPLVENNASAPTIANGNYKRCREERIYRFQGKTPEMSPFKHTLIKEFVELLAAEMLQGREYLEPWSLERCHAKQEKSSQKATWQTGIDDGVTPVNGSDVVPTFQKAESYPFKKTKDGHKKVNDPRNITNFKGGDKVAVAPFAYPMMDAIKNCSWYAFGKTPSDLNKAVANLLEFESLVDELDISRQDGNVSILSRILHHYLFLALFHPRFLEDILEAFSRGWDRTCVSGRGKELHEVVEKYRSIFSRGSGWLVTSLFATIEGKFLHYSSVRLDRRCSAREAYNAPGLFGGDDGLGLLGKPNATIRAGKMFGYPMKVKTVECGNPVMFLARCYSPDVWTGSPMNTCDIPRTLNKLHITHDLVTGRFRPLEKLKQKAMSLWLTDAYTPIIGQWCRAVLSYFVQRPVLPGEDAEELYTALFGKEDANKTLSESWFAKQSYKTGTRFCQVHDGYRVLTGDIDADDMSWTNEILISNYETFDYASFDRWCEAISARAYDFLDRSTLILRPPLCFVDEPLFETNTGPVKDSVPVAVQTKNDTILVYSDKPKKESNHTYYSYCDKYNYKRSGKCKDETCQLKHEFRPKYCTSYAKTGECRFTSKPKGCKFKHEMVPCRRALRGRCNDSKCWKFHPDEACDAKGKEELYHYDLEKK